MAREAAKTACVSFSSSNLSIYIIRMRSDFLRGYMIVRMLTLILVLLLTSCQGINKAQLPQQGNLPPCTKTDCDCRDFATQEEAQKVLDTFPNDPYKLDGDGNGIACESLPRGTGEKPTATQPQTQPSTGESTIASRRAQGANDLNSTSPHLKLGNPSNASSNNLNNYLMEKPQYSLSYNCSTGIPNWVSWQLNTSWLGSVDRSNDFRPDPDLPTGCYQVRPNDYRGSGFDRGHITPSGDRTRTQEDNSATFLMSNMMPQSPANNREVWAELEQYSRELVDQGKELYIIAGGDGQLKTLANGKVSVPANTWKVAVVLDSPNAPVTEATRVIAVRIPNDRSVANTDWQDYRVSVDEIEKATGLDFLSNIPQQFQSVIENKVDK
jgi:endonuclease G